MPQNPADNNPENEENNENVQNVQNNQPENDQNIQNNDPVNAQENAGENDQNNNAGNEQVVPQIDPEHDNLDGVQQEENYIPPVPPEQVGQDDGIEQLNINAEINAQNQAHNQEEDIEQLNINAEINAQNQAQNLNGNRNQNRLEDDVMPGPGGTYQHYFGELRKAEFSEDTIAHMLACAVMMQRDPRARVNRQATEEFAGKVREQPAFALLMADPKAKELKTSGNGVALIELLATKENERKAEMNKYIRPEEYTYEDSLFLTAVREQLEYAENGGTTPGGKKSGKKRGSAQYRAMMKQVRHAEELTNKGIQLSGDETRKLISAVKKYNNGGTDVPGGTKKAPGAVEAMCILKRYMPVDEYLAYCNEINARRKKKIDPEAFTEQRLYGQAVPVTEQKNQSMNELKNSFSVENCAALVACATTAPKNGLIDAEEYERQKAKLMESGSAFRKAMQSEEMRNKVTALLQNGGKANQIIKTISDSAMEGLGKSAQWRFNRSRNALLGGTLNTYFAGEHLANILALHQFSLSASMSDKMTGKSFAERAQVIQSDPVFKRMADRYSSDPEYRRHINDKLRQDGTGQSISEEYGRVQRSMKRRREVPEAQNDQANAEQPQAGAGGV